MSKTVLIVDDQQNVRYYVHKICESLHLDCMEASNVKQALELLSTNTIDLIISDLSMPGETGLHLLQSIRSSGHVIPFMILSGSVNPGEEKKLYEAGANIVLSKTIEPSMLKSAIQKLQLYNKSGNGEKGMNDQCADDAT